jgi:hypothetical protein
MIMIITIWFDFHYHLIDLHCNSLRWYIIDEDTKKSSEKWLTHWKKGLDWTTPDPGSLYYNNPLLTVHSLPLALYRHQIYPGSWRATITEDTEKEALWSLKPNSHRSFGRDSGWRLTCSPLQLTHHHVAGGEGTMVRITATGMVRAVQAQDIR